MTNEELIRTLREYADWADGEEWEVPLMLADHLRQAAESIENFKKRYDFVRWERNLFYKKYMREVPRWISTKKGMPKNDGPVLVAAFATRDPNRISVFKARWIAEQSTIGETEDEDYIPDGWYECSEKPDEYNAVEISGYIVTHWMPLPKAPGVE